MSAIISVQNLSKVYDSGFQALRDVSLDIRRGEIFALLGPNGAGKTTMISIICGIVNPSSGVITADGHDIIRDFRAARSKIGLVPQELCTDGFESVISTVNFSRGLFGRPPNKPYIEQILRQLSLWDKRDTRIMELSGGMKKRAGLARALAQDPEILFLDEPTAGLDPIGAAAFDELINDLKNTLGLTVFMVTHDLDSLHASCDRIAVLAEQHVILTGTMDDMLASQHPWIRSYFHGPRARAAIPAS